jgi:uncharacterized membrane protein
VLHNDVLQAIHLSNEVPEDGFLATNAIMIKNKFERSMYNISSRTGARVTSNVWKYDYAKIIHFSDQGKEIIKLVPGKYNHKQNDKPLYI